MGSRPVLVDGEGAGRSGACATAGMAAGASLTAAVTGGRPAGMLWTAAALNGFPPFALMASCRCSNAGGGAGGTTRATTVRVCTLADGLAATDRPAPRTDCLVGTTAGVTARIGALTIARSSKRTEFLAIGCAVVNAWDVVAATAPGTLRFT